MKNIIKTLWLAMAAAAMIACEKPTPAPDAPEEPTIPQIVNAIEFDGANKTEFKSVIFYEEQLKLYVYASATAGLETVEAITKDKHLMVMVGYGDMNKTINAMTERDALFGMANQTGVGSEITQCGAGMYPDIKAGQFYFVYDQASGKFSVTLSLTAKVSGKVLNANITGNYKAKPAIETDIMKYNNKKYDILKKYYELSETGTTFYLSPLNVDAADLAACAHYTKLSVGKSYLDGAKHDIAKLVDGFEFQYFDIISSINVSIKAGNLKGATGDFTVESSGGGNFTLEYQIVIDGNTIYGKAENLFTKIEATSDFQAYYVYPDGTTEQEVLIKSVVLDKTANGGANWDIYISDVEGLKTVAEIQATEKLLVLRTTAALMTGSKVNLADNDAISITYDGTLYSKSAANVDGGHIQGTYADGDLSVAFLLVGQPIFLEGEYMTDGVLTVIE